MSAPTPPDDAARRRIRSDLDTTLFVEAGAGSGKTTALVDRVVALVAGGAVELRNLAAEATHAATLPEGAAPRVAGAG